MTNSTNIDVEFAPAKRLANGTFANPDHWGYALKTFAEVFEWQWNRKDLSSIPTDAKELDRVLPVVKPIFEVPPPGMARITWLGHASILLQVGDFNILTDPVFSERCSPSSFFGPKRFLICTWIA
jgi:N-acyl-phosphatidylethanolamine-hydrolysing phospholipase D